MKKLIFLILTILIFNSVSWAVPTQQRTGLAWTAPTTNVDGSPYTDAGGFYVYWGTASGAYDDTRSFQITDPADTNVLFSELVGLEEPANYYFAVTAYDTSGNESDYSDEVQNVPFVVPGAPGGLRVE